MRRNAESDGFRQHERRGKDRPENARFDIDWVHTDAKASQSAARKMVGLFQIKFEPSLTSLRLKGQAIDMNISWTGPLKIAGADGTVVEIGTPLSGASNTDLDAVGKGYGLIKLLKDKLHLSSTGN